MLWIPGVSATGSIAEAASGAELFISMLPDSSHVRAALLGEVGAASAAPSGATFVAMSAISPVVTREIRAALGDRGFGFVDAPVSGGVKGAVEGR